MPTASLVLRSVLIACAALGVIAMTISTTLLAQVAPMTEFRQALTPHGRWHQHPRFGAVWTPTVDPDWRPYTRGRWLASDEGWYWHSEEPWAWAVFHYGRWTADPRLGWTWVPGDKWAPSWVTWRISPGDEPTRRVGWAALGPEDRDGSGSNAPETAWVFAPLRIMTAPLLELRLIPVDRNRALLRRTDPAPRGPHLRDVEALSPRPMPYVRLIDARGPEDQSRARSAIQRGVVEVYRPKITSRTDLGPIPPPQPRPPDVPQKTMTDRYLEKGGKGPIVPHRTPAPGGRAPDAPLPGQQGMPRPIEEPRSAVEPPREPRTATPQRQLPTVRPARPAEPKKDAAVAAPAVPKTSPAVTTPTAPAKAEPKSAPAAAPARSGGTPVMPIIVNPGAADK